MAIYKNREVSVVGPNTMANTPETINIKYKDGTAENVAVKDVSFSDEEKKALIKRYPSKFDDVKVASAQDIESVRVGVTPPSDPSYKEMAEREALAKQQKELADKNMAAAKAEADKQIKAQPQPDKAAVTPKAPWVKG